VEREPEFINGMISHYFGFVRMAEEIVEKMASRMVFDGDENSLGKVQRKAWLRLKIDNFPKMKVNMDSASLIQSMIKRQSGCLLRLSNLVVVKTQSQGSFLRKRFYRADCPCSYGHTKCYRYSLLDTIKSQDDLSRHPYLSPPRCAQCKHQYSSDHCSDVYGSYKLVKVYIIGGVMETGFDVLLDGEEAIKTEEGMILEGLFYLDSYTKLSFKGGMFIGNNHRVLIAVDLNPHPHVEIKQIKPELCPIFKAKNEKNYLPLPNPSEDSTYSHQLTSTLASNLKRYLQNISTPSSHPLIDLIILQMLIWHTFNPCSPNPNILLPDIPLERVLNTRVSSSKFSILLFTQDGHELIHRLHNLSRGICPVSIFPSCTDIDSVHRWIVINGQGVMCVQGIERYSPRVYNEIFKCIEMGKGGDGVEIKGSWIVTMGGKGMVGGMRGEGISQWAVVDSFDLILDLTPSASTTTPSMLQALSCILSLHTHGYIPKASIPLNTPYRDIYSQQISEHSDHSRLSAVCNKLCQKLLPPVQSRGTVVDMDAVAARESALASRIVLGYLASAGGEDRVSAKNVVSIKKIAVSLAMLRAFFQSEEAKLHKILSNELEGVFCVDQLDSVLAVVLVQCSRHTIDPNFKGVHLQKAQQCMQALSEINNGVFCPSSSFNSPPHPTTPFYSGHNYHPSNQPINNNLRQVNQDHGSQSTSLQFEAVLEELRELLLGTVEYFV